MEEIMNRMKEEMVIIEMEVVLLKKRRRRIVKKKNTVRTEEIRRKTVEMREQNSRLLSPLSHTG